jgi:hypothetical protein
MVQFHGDRVGLFRFAGRDRSDVIDQSASSDLSSLRLAAIASPEQINHLG